MGGDPFLIHTTLTMNGCGIKMRALVDTGANGYLYMNRPLAFELASSLGLKVQYLLHTVLIRGFNSSIQVKVNQYIRLHLNIDGRRVRNCPFVVLDLGQQDVIIGKKWMKHFRVHCDPDKNRLIWPTDIPPTPYLGKDILIPLSSGKTLHSFSDIQKDVKRRDRAMENDDRRHAKRVRLNEITSSPEHFPSLSLEPSLPESPVTRPKRKRSAGSDPYSNSFSIRQVSANVFHHNMQMPGTEFFTSSLYEIDRIIDEVTNTPLDDDKTTALIRAKLPARYSSYKDVFSKAASDTLAPHRSYDHKIVLTEPLPNSYSPLYRQSTEELKVTKEYLLENLAKGFIVNSNSPFASPVLFVKKPNSDKLRFCIDFRKLNMLTRNDPYPIPRIDELLARMSKAKVFTKLDIRQAFHRIRMDPASEEMTSFRTRYGLYKCKVLPFGLSNGPATYQRYMNDILIEYLDDFCSAYLDDIIIYSENIEDHEDQVKKVLNRLRNAGLQADIGKCEFSVTRIKYLGFILTT